MKRWDEIGQAKEVKTMQKLYVMRQNEPISQMPKPCLVELAKENPEDAMTAPEFVILMTLVLIGAAFATNL